MKAGIFIISFLSLILIFSGCRQGNHAHDKGPRKKDHSFQQKNAIPRSIPLQTRQVSIQQSLQDASLYSSPRTLRKRILRSNALSGISLPCSNSSLKLADSPLRIEHTIILPKESRTADDVFFSATWDNDLFDYTDRYYTNGIGFEWFHPAISSLPLTKLLPGLAESTNYYGISLIQNMYTPLKLNKEEILVGDRPFAAWLAFSLQRISLSEWRRQRVSSELTLGVIGAGAMGNFAQDLIHDETPSGWKYQVNNDMVMNYTIRFEQGLYTGKALEAAIAGGLQAGTLYNNLSAGIILQVGNSNNRYSSLYATARTRKPQEKRVRYFFNLDLSGKLVIYDATLQGGMFDKRSVYVINPENVKRYVFTGTAGFGIGFGRYSLEATQVFLTPEFDGGRKHMWFRIKNIIQLN